MAVPNAGSSCGRLVRRPRCSSPRLTVSARRARFGDQFAGRVGLFLRVDDFAVAYGRMREAGARFVTEPREEPYGQVAVFVDLAGNRWDLLGPRPAR